MTAALFVACCAGLAAAWNRWFGRVGWRVVAGFVALVAAYEAPTLFTARADLPPTAYNAYPWKACDRAAVNANTGIVFTQLAPWTNVAREALLRGELPLWNRAAAGGAPLLANQQTAIVHPFMLLGLLLPIGKAFTLSAALRLFFVLFFTFVFLRAWQLGEAASVFGAVAYAFCTFHVVWLLFPLGLATMMLPLCLSGADGVSRGAGRVRDFLLLVVALSLCVLGGHPESAMWVFAATAGYALYANWRRFAVVALAFAAAILLTAFFWFPTLKLLPETPRYASMNVLAANPANHGLSYEWLLPLVAPNVFGTPMEATYRPPRGVHGAIPNDYGEVASGYAGLATLGLALAGAATVRRRPMWFFIGLALLAFLTFAEAPLWRDLVRHVPVAGIALQQRLRVLWALGVCGAAAMTVDAMPVRAMRAGLVAAACAFIAISAHAPSIYAVIALASVAIVFVAIGRKRFAIFATIAVLLDLCATTFRYNPPANPEDVYPVTGAIRYLMQAPRPSRFAALGWSFLADTPAFYGIEDVKTTDPIANARYLRLMRGYLRVDPASYDLVIGDTTLPFFDYLNVRHVYVPPGVEPPNDRALALRYRGRDGSVYENAEALPRYFLPSAMLVEPDFGMALLRSKEIADFRRNAIVDHVPIRVAEQARPFVAGGEIALRSGRVRVTSYEAGATELAVDSDGWNLLVSSDVAWPGWRAYWNGERQPPVVVNGAFLGVFIPPGRGTLVLRYRPDAFDQGLRASAWGVALLLATLFALQRARNRQREVRVGAE